MLSTFDSYKIQTELKLSESSDILNEINVKFNLAQISILKDDLDKHSKIMEELNTKWTILRNYIELISDQTSINHLFKMLETQVKHDDRLKLESSFLESIIIEYVSHILSSLLQSEQNPVVTQGVCKFSLFAFIGAIDLILLMPASRSFTTLLIPATKITFSGPNVTAAALLPLPSSSRISPFSVMALALHR